MGTGAVAYGRCPRTSGHSQSKHSQSRAQNSTGMPEVALAGMRAGAVAVLGAVALAGAAVAGMEQALTPGPAPQRVSRVAPGAPPAPHTPAPAGAAAGGPVTGAAGRAAGPPCAPPVRICVQLSNSSAWLLRPDGTAAGPVPVRHGRPDSPTPVGLFPIEVKNATHVNSVTGSPMPFALFFARDLALYQAELTEPSAGSIRLPPGPAGAFFGAASVGDLIQVVP